MGCNTSAALPVSAEAEEANAAKEEAVEDLAKKEDPVEKTNTEDEVLRKARDIVKPELAERRIKFYFILAKKLCARSEKTLPALQSLLSTPDLKEMVVELEMTFEDACRGKYMDKFCIVSHRWLTEGVPEPRKAPPDPKGVQLAAIKEFLQSRTSIEYVWVDWLCMWQNEKEGQRNLTVDEKAEFSRMLGEVNLLYLGCQVLVLLDLSYLSRFWTMYEAWLSSLALSAHGLQLAEASRRRHIVPMLGATPEFCTALTASIARNMATPAAATGYLQNDDVSVTNQSDKQKQLAKVADLSERVRTVFIKDAAATAVAQAFAADPVDMAVLKNAVEQASLAGVLPTKFDTAARCVRAVGDQATVSRTELAASLTSLMDEELITQRGTTLGKLKLAGAGPDIAKRMGYELHELKAVGYVEGLKNAGFTCEELLSVGFTCSEVAQAGFLGGEAKAAGCFKTLAEAKEAGFVQGLAEAGFRGGLKKAGFTATEFLDAGFQFSELKQEGFTVQEVLGAVSFFFLLHRHELKRAGFTVREVVDAGAQGELKRAGFTAQEVVNAGAQRALKKGGFTAQEAVNAGAQKALKEGGFTAQEAVNAGAQKALKEGGFTAREVLDAGLQPKVLRELGFTPKEVLDQGAQGALKQAGFTLKEVVDGGAQRALKEEGFTVQEVVAAGAQRALKEGGFTVQEVVAAGAQRALKEGGFTVQEVVDAGCEAKVKEAFTVKDVIVSGAALWEKLGAMGFSRDDVDRAGYYIPGFSAVFPMRR